MPTEVEVYDLEAGVVLERYGPVARELEKFERYSRAKPANWDEIVAAAQNRLAATKAVSDPGPAAPMTRNVWIGTVADAIETLDRESDFNRDGTPDRRKLAGALHVNSVSKEDTDAAMALLGRLVSADDGGEASGPEDDKSQGGEE